MAVIRQDSACSESSGIVCLEIVFVNPETKKAIIIDIGDDKDSITGLSSFFNVASNPEGSIEKFGYQVLEKRVFLEI